MNSSQAFCFATDRIMRCARYTHEEADNVTICSNFYKNRTSLFCQEKFSRLLQSEKYYYTLIYKLVQYLQ